MAEKAKKPVWSLWAGGRRAWKGDVKVQIYLRANAPRDAAGNIVIPADDHKALNTYDSDQLVWSHEAKPSGGDIVLVRRA